MKTILTIALALLVVGVVVTAGAAGLLDFVRSGYETVTVQLEGL